MSFEQSQTYHSNTPFNDERTQAFPSTPVPNFKPQPGEMNFILVIKKLKDSKAADSDGIPLTYLKHAIIPVAIYIIVINTFIVTYFPKRLEASPYYPFLQDWRWWHNYRPISLQTILSSTTLEKIIADQLTIY